jgi:hypothetical protein
VFLEKYIVYGTCSPESLIGIIVINPHSTIRMRKKEPTKMGETKTKSLMENDRASMKKTRLSKEKIERRQRNAKRVSHENKTQIPVCDAIVYAQYPSCAGKQKPQRNKPKGEMQKRQKNS